MTSVLWNQYLTVLQAAGPYFLRDGGELDTFVKDLPQAGRIPLLLTACEHYRETTDPALQTAHGSLIGRLLAARLKPTDAEACVLLGTACASNLWDYLQPIEVADRAFRGRPYPSDLFDSARAYREELVRLRDSRTKRARDTIDLLLWHDVRRPARGCWSSRIQRAIAEMDSAEAFAWQWMLRNSWVGLSNRSNGKAWAAAGRPRLEQLGMERFFQRVDTWLQFQPGERIRMSLAGSHYLRLLVLYSGLADRSRAVPILQRLANGHWSQRDRIRKVIDSLPFL